MQVEDNSNSLSDKPTKGCCCSECSNKPMCPVISSIDNSILFVDYDIKLHCRKAMSFGFSYICKCKGRLKYYQSFRK